ncbi:Isochorismatase [Bacillus cereus Rock1-3]|nr:Isochorismatase [Bacillus cereus Rock1-3]MDH6560951.1 aryl carrier-like protein [Bacillus sp. LEw-kw-2]
MDSIKIKSFVEILRRRGLEVTYMDSAESPTSNDWWELIFLK